jgi:uncharacterized protein YjlB
VFGHVKPKIVTPITFSLSSNGRMPNSHLPVLLYRGAGKDGEDLETFFKHQFAKNHWGGQWALGIYGYHHFHSNAHEALGIAVGRATLVLGGEGGLEVEVSAGDVLVLPAGTGHRRIRDSWDFWVVGAYPRGQENFDEYTDRAMCTNCGFRLRAVSLPKRDPLFGAKGPLVTLWQRSA